MAVWVAVAEASPLECDACRVTEVEREPDNREATAEFTRLMVDGIDRLQREIVYNPTRFRQMVGEHGGVGAAQRLLRGPDASDGFTTLWEAHRLELSVEAHVLLPRFASLFAQRELRMARHRLEEHGFDVDAFLARIGDGLA